MKCHTLNNRNFMTRRWHRLWCRECRKAESLDALIGFGLMQMQAEPTGARGLETTLNALNLPQGGRDVRRASGRLVGKWLLRGVRNATIALCVVVVWYQYMNYIPPMTIPTKAVPAPNAFDIFKAAGAQLADRNEWEKEQAEAQQPLNDPPTRERRDARLKRKGKALPTVAQLRAEAARNGVAVTFDEETRPIKINNTRLSKSAYATGLVYDSTKVRMPYTRAEKQALVDECRPALAKLREGFHYPYVDVYPRRWDVQFSYYAQFRALARALSMEADIKAERGDWNGAMQSDLDAMQMGVMMSHGAPLIGRLVGVACEAIGQKGAWKALPHLNAREAKAATARLEAICANMAPYAETMYEEKWFGQAALREQMRQPNWRASFATLVGSGENRAMSIALLGWSNRIILKDMTSVWDQVIQRDSLPYAQLHKLGEIREPFDPLVQMLFPVFEQAHYKSVYTEQTQSALLVTSLALRAYAGEHSGRYPERLEQLTPTYLRQIPADPFSADGRAPLQYRRQAGEEVWKQIVEAARQNNWKPNLRNTYPYALYSVGPDGKDDGGNPVDLLKQPSREPGPVPQITTGYSHKSATPPQQPSKKLDPKVPYTASELQKRFLVQSDSLGDIVAGVNTR